MRRAHAVRAHVAERHRWTVVAYVVNRPTRRRGYQRDRSGRSARQTAVEGPDPRPLGRRRMESRKSFVAARQVQERGCAWRH